MKTRWSVFQNGKLYRDILNQKFRTKIDISDPDTLGIKIEDQLTPDTEYVFKIRAIYASGPGVFSEPCIMKTLPEGMRSLVFAYLKYR